MNVLITGASSGIGKQLALDYARDGHRVYACGRNEAKLAELANTADGGLIQPVIFDVMDREATGKALSALTDIDCAILNAGVCEYVNSPEEFDGALFERVFAANFFGVVYCIEALLKNMQKGSRLVIVDSMARLLPFTRAEAYGASKAAVHYLGNTLKVDLQARGIQVSTVSPGFVETPMTDANDFDMPMRISVTDASKAMRAGIQKGQSQIWFPRVFGWILRGLHKLPSFLQLIIARGMKKDN